MKLFSGELFDWFMPRRTVLVIFALFLLVNCLYLASVPGLMGDEASEGENVYELLTSGNITVVGERSYIGPLIDYVRVPFVGVFGYTAIALRAVMFVFSALTFLLALQVFKRLFGSGPGLMAAVIAGFSPIYLTYARLGWTITLFPFFALLILYLLLSDAKYKQLLAGLAAGLGLHNHIMFLPTLVAIAVIWGIYLMRRPKQLWLWWPGAVGFWAGFGTQFAVLRFFKDDQGDPTLVAQGFGEKLADLPKLMPLILSGSSYIARYTGNELTPGITLIALWVLLVLVALALVLPKYRWQAWVWLAGLGAQMTILLVLIDRYTLRYFMVWVLGVWVLAGVGLGKTVLLLSKKKEGVVAWASIGLAVILSAVFIWLVVIPFKITGGSTADFSLGNRVDSASALADGRGLAACLRGVGPVSSENVHIFNRLLYLGHQYADLDVKVEEDINEARWLVDYRAESDTARGDLCPELKHFVIQQARR
ncbi:MAG: glycosyltransferase family 39 protein [Candidatus Andersenbacteria bacterium]|nr:glycosyltransferase family 39 protein [bacterium]MDZ4225697.1 glycosyltransferase family 39 protein [Candidatus Andersenbacteria bacterium]